MMTFIMQIPGIGLYTGMTILAAIGDIARFPTPSQLVGYAGLGARVRASGDWYQTGRISKRGRRELRTALVNSAWVAVRFSSYWRCKFEKMAARIGKWIVMRMPKLLPGLFSDGLPHITWPALRGYIVTNLSGNDWTHSDYWRR
jgi:hypothetical protein